MPITLVIEDGTGKEDANAFIDVLFARDYAVSRGYVLPEDDEAVKAQIVNATDFIQSTECKMQGFRTTATQALCFPREQVYIHCTVLQNSQIPYNLKAASASVVIAINEGFNPLPNVSSGDMIVREKVGPIETEYADPLQVGYTPVLSATKALLNPLFGLCGIGGALVTKRV